MSSKSAVSSVDAIEILPHYYIGNNYYAPKGSALLTHSGHLNTKANIKGIIHAAPGAMTGVPDNGEPTLASVVASVKNSVLLALLHEATHLRIPLIGGKIFLPRFVPAVTLEQLAYAIMEIAIRTREEKSSTDCESLQLHFLDIDYEGYDAFKTAYKSFNTVDHIYVSCSSIIVPFSDTEKRMLPTGGRKTIETHAMIVNAANIEMRFGGGLSGSIGSQTGQSDAINQDAQETLKEFYENQEKLNKNDEIDHSTRVTYSAPPELMSTSGFRLRRFDESKKQHRSQLHPSVIDHINQTATVLSSLPITKIKYIPPKITCDPIPVCTTVAAHQTSESVVTHSNSSWNGIVVMVLLIICFLFFLVPKEIYSHLYLELARNSELILRIPKY